MSYSKLSLQQEEMIREHAQARGFPANRVSEIKSVIDPTSADR